MTPSPSDPGPVILAGRRVLVIDDDEFVARAIMRMLGAHGCKVEACACGRTGRDRLVAAVAEHRRPDVVLVDATIPNGTGGQVALGLLREADPAVRTVLISGYAESLSQDGGAAGFDGILQKPFTLAELCAAVQRALAG